MSLVNRPNKKNEGEDKKPTRFFSKKQENTVASSTGGKRQPNSGACRFNKGDVVVSDEGENSFLLECKTKTTASESISIKKEWFEKNTKETLLTGSKYSAIVFNFGPGEENHYIIDEYLFQELQEYLKGKNNG